MPRNVRARRALNENMTEYGFFKSYRGLFGESNRDFTWVRKRGPQRARLDMGIASNSLRPYIKNFEKFTSFNSDNNPIILTLDYAAFSRERGLWKHNYKSVERYGLCRQCPNLMTLSRGLNLPKTGFNRAPA